MFLFPSCDKDNQDENNNENDDLPMLRSYEFNNGIIPQNVLESYLSRSITQGEFLRTAPFWMEGEYPDAEDDTRMLLNIGAKFIGRSIYSWDYFDVVFINPDFLGNAKTKIDELHRIDPDIVFQAAIFEIVSPKVEVITIPDWVFEAFDLPFEERNFNYSNMLNKEGLFVDHWGKGASVPDISRIETQMFFYFMACKYMEIGIEAIHFGQVELMAMGDSQNYAYWSSLLQKVRNAALDKARRGTIICDGHLPSGGIVIDGKHIFDFVSFPLRPKEIIGDPQKAELKKFYLDAMYGRTKGGITPSGWTCDRIPYLVEFDNNGISDHPGEGDINDYWVWGYDEISWFSNQPEEYRNYFLHYAADWIKKVDPIGYLQMPGSRYTVGADTPIYRANTKNRCRVGKNQEETIKKIWEELN
jgi:hypothetical protein